MQCGAVRCGAVEWCGVELLREVCAESGRQSAISGRQAGRHLI